MQCFEKYICTKAIKEAGVPTGPFRLDPYQDFMARHSFEGRQALDATLQQLQTVNQFSRHKKGPKKKKKKRE